MHTRFFAFDTRNPAAARFRSADYQNLYEVLKYIVRPIASV